jgi:site-specific DNA-methyltransferase (adenine-specific)
MHLEPELDSTFEPGLVERIFPRDASGGEEGGVTKMKPYYEHAGIQIYLGDCRDVLSLLSVPAILTDPPYGISYCPLRGSNGSKMWGHEVVTGDDNRFDPSHLVIDRARYPRVVLWGANNYSHLLPASRGWLCWDKTSDGIRHGFVYSHFELGWTNFLTRAQKFSLNWQGADREGEDFLHPTQKPLGLMEWCVDLMGDVETICDPYMGSGTTLIAAKNRGKRAIGIEIEEKYCEIAAKRLSQEVFNFDDGRSELSGQGPKRSTADAETLRQEELSI